MSYINSPDPKKPKENGSKQIYRLFTVTLVTHLALATLYFEGMQGVQVACFMTFQFALAFALRDRLMGFRLFYINKKIAKHEKKSANLFLFGVFSHPKDIFATIDKYFFKISKNYFQILRYITFSLWTTLCLSYIFPRLGIPIGFGAFLSFLATWVILVSFQLPHFLIVIGISFFMALIPFIKNDGQTPGVFVPYLLILFINLSLYTKLQRKPLIEEEKQNQKEYLLPHFKHSFNFLILYLCIVFASYQLLKRIKYKSPSETFVTKENVKHKVRDYAARKIVEYLDSRPQDPHRESSLSETLNEKIKNFSKMGQKETSKNQQDSSQKPNMSPDDLRKISAITEKMKQNQASTPDAPPFHLKIQPNGSDQNGSSPLMPTPQGERQDLGASSKLGTKTSTDSLHKMMKTLEKPTTLEERAALQERLTDLQSQLPNQKYELSKEDQLELHKEWGKLSQKIAQAEKKMNPKNKGENNPPETFAQGDGTPAGSEPEDQTSQIGQVNSKIGQMERGLKQRQQKESLIKSPAPKHTKNAPAPENMKKEGLLKKRKIRDIALKLDHILLFLQGLFKIFFAFVFLFLIYRFSLIFKRREVTKIIEQQIGLSEEKKRLIKRRSLILAQQNLSSEQEVFLTYKLFLETMSFAHYPKDKWNPPTNYAGEVINKFTHMNTTVGPITELFCKSYYGKRGVSEDEIKILRAARVDFIERMVS